jgi:hypothetical protein
MENYPDIVLLANISQFDGPSFFPIHTYEETNRRTGMDLGVNNKSLPRNKINQQIYCILCTGKPEYSQKIWSGEIVETSDKPDLSEKAEMMIQRLFSEHFKHRSILSSKPN